MWFTIEGAEDGAMLSNLDACNGGWLAWRWRDEVGFENGVGLCGDWGGEDGSRETWPETFGFAFVVVEEHVGKEVWQCGWDLQAVVREVWLS